MLPTGINFYSSLASVTGKLAILYSFTGSGFNFLPSVPHGNSIYSGRIQNTGNFHQPNRSGSGFFDGYNFINISNASGLNSQNSWTTIINYEQSGNQNSVLFSSYQSGSINSGYIIGINNNCQPYLEYYSNAGPQVLLSNNNWGSKNSLWVTKTSNNISIEYLNLNNKQFESESFNIDDTYWVNSDIWLIGNKTGTPNYFSGYGFAGYIDLFCHFSPSLLSYEKDLIKSGIYVNNLNPIIYITTGYTSGITGYDYINIPIFSGVTGFQIFSGIQTTGVCDQVTNIYYSGNLTGIVYESGLIPVYQTVTDYYTGISGVNNIENSGYSISFGMDGVSYLQNINAGDLSELYYYPNSTNKTNINQELSFDRILNKFILPQIYDTKQINFYINSVAQFGSGYNISGDFYGSTVVISGMYFNSGSYLSGNYNGMDTNIIDIVSGVRSFCTGKYTPAGPVAILNNFFVPNNSMVFYEGVKMASGTQYVISSNILFLKSLYLTGIVPARMWTFPSDSESYFYSGIFNNFTTGKFARGTSQLYLNGLRENINDSYLEISKFSLLNNSGNYIDNLNIIYNNENDWIEEL